MNVFMMNQFMNKWYNSDFQLGNFVAHGSDVAILIYDGFLPLVGNAHLVLGTTYENEGAPSALRLTLISQPPALIRPSSRISGALAGYFTA